MRTEKNLYFLELALRCANQGTCMRRNYGAVIVDSNNTIVSTGYTGAPSGQDHCEEIGYCWREKNNIPSGSNYNFCRSVHAEMNALIQAGKCANGSRLYLSGIDAKTKEIVANFPCFLCAKMIVNAFVAEVIILNTDGKSYKSYTPVDIFAYRQKEALGI